MYFYLFRYLLWPDWIFFIRSTEGIKTMLIILALGHNLSDRSIQKFFIEFINFLQGTIISTCSSNHTNWNDTWSVILFFSNFNMNFGLGMNKIIIVMSKIWVGFVVQEKVATNAMFLKFIYSEKASKFCEIFTPYFWLVLHRTKVRWMFRKILWPSQNTWTLWAKKMSFWVKHLKF